MTSFAQTLDVIESLRVDEQEHILEVLQRRLAERRRAAGRRISGTPPPGPEKPVCCACRTQTGRSTSSGKCPPAGPHSSSDGKRLGLLSTRVCAACANFPFLAGRDSVEPWIRPSKVTARRASPYRIWLPLDRAGIFDSDFTWREGSLTKPPLLQSPCDSLIPILILAGLPNKRLPSACTVWEYSSQAQNTPLWKLSRHFYWLWQVTLAVHGYSCSRALQFRGFLTRALRAITCCFRPASLKK